MLTAVVLASSVEPATKWFSKYKIPRLPSVIMVYLLVAVILFGTFYLLIPPLLSETSGFLSTAPEYLSSLDVTESVTKLFDSRETIDGLAETLSAQDLISGLRSYILKIPGGVFGAVSNVFGGVLSFVLIIIFSFYLAVQETGIDDFLKIITPRGHEKYVLNLWRRSQDKIGKWMQGQLLLMLIIGVLVYLSLSILGVKHAFLFAVLAALFELIPLFGPILASIPAIVVGFTSGGFGLAIVVAGVYVVIQQFENHLIYPLVVNKVVGVPALLVILSLIIGAQLAGFLGIILSVPIAAAIMELTKDIKERNKQLAGEV
jgi:predicted PurR-regulated permease PerM